MFFLFVVVKKQSRTPFKKTVIKFRGRESRRVKGNWLAASHTRQKTTQSKEDV